MKHFNAGNVWGRIVEIKKEKTHKQDKPFLSIHIDCTGNKGRVHTYGRLWGQDRIDQFILAFKENPTQTFRLRGFFSQYISTSSIRLTNFSFFSWALAPTEEPRAAFILKGLVNNIETRDGEGILGMRLIREGQNGYPETKEEFEVYTFGPELLEGFKVDELWEIKGYLQQGEGEDEFGVAEGPVHPYILQASKKE